MAALRTVNGGGHRCLSLSPGLGLPSFWSRIPGIWYENYNSDISLFSLLFYYLSMKHAGWLVGSVGRWLGDWVSGYVGVCVCGSVRRRA